MTTRLPDPRDDLASPPATIDLDAYAGTVADVVAEAVAARERAGSAELETVLARWLIEPEIARVLDATPAGYTAADELMRQVREHPPADGDRCAARIRTFLLSQVDAAWWGWTEPYRTDADVLCTGELVDLAGPRGQGLLRFRYRAQPTNPATRLAHAAQRRLWPGGRPHVAGLRFCRARPELVILLNQVAARFADAAPAGTPPLWVTSLARSVDHQIRLGALGYPIMLPSAHCVGYAADVEMAWYRRFRADRALAEVLLERRAAGEVNLIDEGQVWHVCLHPHTAALLVGRTINGH